LAQQPGVLPREEHRSAGGDADSAEFSNESRNVPGQVNKLLTNGNIT